MGRSSAALKAAQQGMHAAEGEAAKARELQARDAELVRMRAEEDAAAAGTGHWWCGAQWWHRGRRHRGEHRGGWP